MSAIKIGLTLREVTSPGSPTEARDVLQHGTEDDTVREDPGALIDTSVQNGGHVPDHSVLPITDTTDAPQPGHDDGLGQGQGKDHVQGHCLLCVQDVNDLGHLTGQKRVKDGRETLLHPGNDPVQGHLKHSRSPGRGVGLVKGHGL